ALLAWSLSRAGIALVMYVAQPLIIDAAAPPPYHLRPDNIILDGLGSRWDTGFYLDIAEHGYVYEGAALPSVAFFPLLPLLMRAVGALIGDTLVAGLLISNLALLGAAMLLHRLTDDEWGPAVADRAVWYLLIFPASLFGSAIYTESLLLFAAIGALYAARKGAWEIAALLGIAAALTRLVGVVVAPMLLAEWWMQRQRGERRPPAWALLAGLAPPLGTLAYMGFLHWRFGDALAFAHAAAAWAREPRSPLAMLGALFARPAEGWLAALPAGRIPLDNWIDALFALAFLALGGLLLWRRRWSEGVFVALGALIPLSSGLLMSQRRYVWVLFPAFILLARWGGRPWVDRLLTLAFALGLALMSALFVNWYWVG
ncbi:MAG TPA: mannosyltransferase family protein, partial [Herpetosiphonaceae bacterium]